MNSNNLIFPPLLLIVALIKFPVSLEFKISGYRNNNTLEGLNYIPENPLSVIKYRSEHFIINYGIHTNQLLKCVKSI